VYLCLLCLPTTPILLDDIDGHDVYTPIVDSDGHLQVDVVAAGLPDGAATEATLADVLAQLDVVLSTRAAEEGGNLATLVAALDVALSTRAAESGGNLAAVLAALDVALSTRAVEDGGNLAALVAALDVALSTRAAESGGNLAASASSLALLEALLDALASVALDKLRVTLVDPLPAGTNNIGDVDLAGHGWTPVRKTGNYNAAQTDTVIWAPAAGKAIVLLGVLLSTDTAMSMQLESSNVDVIPPCYFAANGGAVISGGGPVWEGAADATLDLTSSAAGNHSVLLWGYEK
jgi:hypothetical protein